MKKNIVALIFYFFFSHCLLSQKKSIVNSDTIFFKNVKESFQLININFYAKILASPFSITQQTFQISRQTTLYLPNHTHYNNPVLSGGIFVSTKLSKLFRLGLDTGTYFISNEVNSARNKTSNYFLFPLIFKGQYHSNLTLLETISMGAGKSFGTFQSEFYLQERGGFTSEIVLSTSKIRIKNVPIKLEITYNYNQQSNVIDFDKTNYAQLDPEVKGKFEYSHFRHLLGFGVAIDL